jgi:TrmH family RNA methyltransferase
MTPERITSFQNPKLKRLLALQEKSSLRRETGLFVVEGLREVERCIDSGFIVDTLFICPELVPAGGDASLRGIAPEGRNTRGSVAGGPSRRDGGVSPEGELLKGQCRQPGVPGGKVIELSRAVYEKVAYRGGTEGVIAEVKARNLALEDLQLPENPLVVVMESVEKPGNLGAVLRSADAAGADAVLVCEPLTDLYNPNLIRASLGAVFHCPVCCCTTEAAIAFLKARGIRILTAQLQDSAPYYGTDMKQGTALVMGSEAQGLGTAWRAAADAHVLIPMQGIVDSLNVSVSAAILLFEAVRQRAE